jgi:hypothetical protein
MKKPRISFGLAIAALTLAGTAAAQTSVGVSVSVHQPGVYGRIDIGNAPPPVVYARPVIITQPAVVVPAQPTYLYVPPGHQKNWRKHCHRYNACGQPVYFVKESWIRERYEEDRRHHHHDDHGPGQGKGHGKGKGPKHKD